MRTPGILWLALLAPLVTVGCSTIHPRAQADLAERTNELKRLAVLFPDVRVAVSYTGTEMLMYSPEVSTITADLMQARCEKVLEDMGYTTESLEAVDFRPEVSADTLLPWIHTGFQAPPGVPSTSRPVLTNERARRVAAAEAVLASVVSNDPDYFSAVLAEDLTYKGPYADLAGYDLVLLVFGTTRAETTAERYWRWVKNLTLNLLMVPVAAVSFFIPIALPLTISLSFFFEGTPDRSFYGLVAFDPRTGRVEFTNDFFQRGAASLDDAEYAIERMLEDFPLKKRDQPAPDENE